MYSKEELWLIVAKLFGDKGYQGSTMRDIAQALAMSEVHVAGVLGTREEMLWHIISRAAGLFLTQARTVPRTISPAEQLHLLIYRHLEVVSQDREPVRVFLRDWIFLDEVHQREIQAMRETYEAYFYHIIVAGVKEKVFRVPDCLLACLFVLSALQWTHQWFNASDSLTFTRLADQYSVLLLNALRSEHIVPLDGALDYLYQKEEQPD